MGFFQRYDTTADRAYELGLANALESAAAFGSRVTLCLVDVDDFKQINDAYGHLAGDVVRSAPRERMHAAVRRARGSESPG